MLWLIILAGIFLVPFLLFIGALCMMATRNEEHAEHCCDELHRRQG